MQGQNEPKAELKIKSVEVVREAELRLDGGLVSLEQGLGLGLGLGRIAISGDIDALNVGPEIQGIAGM